MNLPFFITVMSIVSFALRLFALVACCPVVFFTWFAPQKIRRFVQFFFASKKNPLRLTQNAFFCAIAPCSWFFAFSLLSHRLRLTPFPLRLGGGLCRASTARAHARAARRSGGRRDSQAKRACPRR